MHLNQPVVGGQITADNSGYLLAAADGGIFTFGNAQFAGSAGSLKLNEPVVGIGQRLEIWEKRALRHGDTHPLISGMGDQLTSRSDSVVETGA